MKLKLLSIGLFSVSTLLTLAASAIKPAFAICTATDVSVQVALSDEPSVQNNHVTVDSEKGCFGNNSTHVMTQYGAGDRVTQTRESHHHLGSSENNPLKQFGVETPTIYTPVDVRVNVPNPAARFRR